MQAWRWVAIGALIGGLLLYLLAQRRLYRRAGLPLISWRQPYARAYIVAHCVAIALLVGLWATNPRPTFGPPLVWALSVGTTVAALAVRLGFSPRVILGADGCYIDEPTGAHLLIRWRDVQQATVVGSGDVAQRSGIRLVWSEPGGEKPRKTLVPLPLAVRDEVRRLLSERVACAEGPLV